MSSGTSSSVTMAMIAKRAGVHVSTVSRALQSSGNRRQRDKTREILRIAEELGYRPNPIASALRSQRTHAIGVLVPRLTDYVLARIYEGVDDAAMSLGFTTFVGNTQDRPQLRAQRLSEFLDRRAEGMILGDARLGGDDVVKALTAQGVPFVLTSRRLRGHLSVTTDDLRGGEIVGEHLLSLGHERVAIVAGEPYASTGVERSKGCQKVFQAAGLEIPKHLVLTSRFDADGGRKAAEALLAREPRLTAIFAVNDTAAIGAMGAVRAAGRQIGHDVAIVGYNDIPIAAQLPVPLTTVVSPMFQMGARAATLLIERIGGAAPRSERLTPSLVIRASTRP